jgi:hypothetical protein
MPIAPLPPKRERPLAADRSVEEAGGVNPYMFRDARLKLLLAETLLYAKLIAD